MEVTVCSIRDKRIVNRGFLLGPYCPIYGFGGIFMLPLYNYRHDILVCFILAFFIGGFVEYISSYLLEKIFKVRWWDYSRDHYNLNGRICLRNCLAFGLLGVLASNYLFPLSFKLLEIIDDYKLVVSVILLIITTLDIVISCRMMNKIKNSILNNLSKFKGDATNDIKKMINDNILNNANYLQKRIIKNYHEYVIKRDDFINMLKDSVKSSERTINFTWIGFILSLILGYFTKKYIICFIAFITIGFIIDEVRYKRK